MYLPLKSEYLLGFGLKSTSMDMLKAGPPEVIPVGTGLVLRGEGKTHAGMAPWARPEQVHRVPY